MMFWEAIAMKISFYRFAAISAMLVLVLSAATSAFSQGKGNRGGSSRGNSSSTSRGNSSTTDRGNINRGRDDDRRADDSRRGVSDRRGRSENAESGGANRFRGLSKKTGLSQDDLRNRFEAERALNPDLTYGQFVAAHMVTRNNKNVSTEGILEGLRNGDSIGRSLHRAGLSESQIKSERKRLKKLMKDDDDFKDRDRDWRIFR